MSQYMRVLCGHTSYLVLEIIHVLMKKINDRKSISTIAAVIGGILVLQMIFIGTTQDASAHIQKSCDLTTSDRARGNVIKNTNEVWAALGGTGKIIKYPAGITNCTTQITYYTVGGDPTFLSVSGSTRVVFTEYSSAKILVFRTDTGTVERTVTLSYNPWDIVTDPSDSNKVWFTHPNTNRFASMVVSTGSVTTYTITSDTNIRTRANAADTTYIFMTDTGTSQKILRYTKSSGSLISKVVTEGISYGITLDNTNAQIWGTLYTPNKLFDMTKSLSSYSLLNGHTGTSGMYRIDMASTDVLVTYLTSGHTGAIHVIPPGAYHDADFVGTRPYDVSYDISDLNLIGSQVTVEGNASNKAKVVELTHFPS